MEEGAPLLVLPDYKDGGSVPMTIVTGFLGAGKSTLVNHILREKHGLRIAVIVNEFGNSAEIEREIILNESDGNKESDVLELQNGCICCSLKNAGVQAIENLMKRRGRFDHIVLETSGVGDPGEIAKTFWVEDALHSQVYLDGIVALVDAKHCDFANELLKKIDPHLLFGINTFKSFEATLPAKTTIHSICLETATVALDSARKWIQWLLWESNHHVWRLKGFISPPDSTATVVVQGVYEILDEFPLSKSVGKTRIVLLGDALNEGEIRESFRRALEK